MKELSIEEKAKRYDEALEKLRSLHDDYDTVSTLIDIKEELENIFPELKESEDERIRKALIHIVKGACSKYGIKYQGKEIGEEKLLAWLEKHVEQKPQRMVSAEAKETMYDKPAGSEEDAKICGKCIDAASGYYSPEDKQIMKDWLRNLKDRFMPQPKQEWGEEDEMMLEGTIDKISDLGTGEMCKEWLKSLKDRVQSKQEWNGEDERMLKNMSNIISDHYIYESLSAEDGADLQDWLKTLKDRCISQPKWWSEEDKKRLEDIVVLVSGYADKRVVKDWVEWLKSLRPQNRWKPSEEQIEALESATENCAYSEYQDCLRELIGQLKKLRKE